MNNQTTRRSFIKQSGAAATALCLGNTVTLASESKIHLATNQYSWLVYYQREQKNFLENLDDGLQDIKKSGLDGLETMINSPQDIEHFSEKLKQHGLEMRSIYVNSTLHEQKQADKSIDQVVAIAEKAVEAGTKIIVTNPSPISWSGEKSKTDAELIIQAKALNRLGEKLSEIGITLSYHNHAPELQNAAREFHHMMVGTDPNYVTLCLDAHWIYRGSGNSQVALFDIIELYGARITELHLRQSHAGTWSEAFGSGDIDYQRLAEQIRQIGIEPHFVLEQAVEQGTPHTLGPVEAHQQSAKYARKLFE